MPNCVDNLGMSVQLAVKRWSRNFAVGFIEGCCEPLLVLWEKECRTVCVLNF